MPAPFSSPARALVLTAWCWIGAACAELPTLPSDACGNGVVEGDEDCDTFSNDKSFVCRPPGSEGACHFDCRRAADGDRPACPAGWGCDANGLCRAPTGEFTSAGSYSVGPVGALLAGDFDGDGRADIMSREPGDALDQSRLALHFFDERGALQETHDFHKSVAVSRLVDVSHDRLADLVVSNFAVGLLLGRSDRDLVTETFSSYRLPDTRVRMLGVYENRIDDAPSLILFGAIDGQPAFQALDSRVGRLRTIGTLPGRIEDAVSDPAAGNILEDVHSPCDELVLGLRGESSFLLFDVCDRDLVTSEVFWRESAEQHQVALPADAAIDAAPLVTDMNGDGHLDVLIGASGRAYVSYGDGTGLKAAVPYSVMVSYDLVTSEEVSSMPLAAGDFTGDGAVDFVSESWLISSVPRFDGGPPRYIGSHQSRSAPWTVAHIADLNGNGKIGVVAASNQGLGIDVFSGTGRSYLTQTSLPTRAPVLLLNVGDLDGDLTNDLAFVESAATLDQRATLRIAFGNQGRPPSAPQVVARLQDPEELSVYRDKARGNLLIASSQRGPDRFGTVTLLDGSADRILFAAYALVTFSDDGNVQDFPALSVLAGAFSGPEHADVIAFGADTMNTFRFWFLRDLELGQSIPARLVHGALDPSFVPVTEEGEQVQLRIASTAADLDGDGRDEAVWAMPTSAGGCGLFAFNVDASSEPALVPYGTLLLDEPCRAPQLEAFDADADGALDILLLTGSEAQSDHRLLTLWNDGAGGFAKENVTQLSDRRHAPQAFTTLPAITVRDASAVYVTKDEAFLVTARGKTRGFGAPSSLAQLVQGSAVAGADINGDGALDLAIAENARLSVLLGGLKTP